MPKHIHTQSCKQVVRAASGATVKNWTQSKRPSPGEQTSKTWYSHAVGDCCCYEGLHAAWCGQKKNRRRTLITMRSAIMMWKNQLLRNGPVCKPHLEAHSQQSLSDTVKAVHFCAGKNMSKLGTVLTLLSASLLSLLLTQPIALA